MVAKRYRRRNGRSQRARAEGSALGATTPDLCDLSRIGSGTRPARSPRLRAGRQADQLQLQFVRAMQELIASSEPSECVGLYCAQLLDLGEPFEPA